MTSAQIDIYRMKTLGAADADIAQANAMSEKIKAYDAEQKALGDVAAFRESLKSPAEKYQDEMDRLGGWLDKGLISPDQYGQGAEKLKENVEDTVPLGQDMHAGALERGSVGAYSASLPAMETLRESMKKNEKHNQQTAKNTREMIDTMEGIAEQMPQVFTG